MGLFGEVKCGRCDRRYSAIRNRCPYCGARKRRSGKSTGDGDNRWQVVFGVILLVVIVIAVAVLIIKNIKEGGSGSKTTPTPTIQATATPKATATPTPTGGLPAVTPAPTAKVTSVVLSRQDFTLSKIGETWVLSATITPTGATTNVVWTSLDPKVATVTADGRVTAIANGTTTITAEAGGVKASCVVRVSAAGAPSASNSGGTSSPGGATSGVSLSHTDVTLNATTSESFTLKVNGSTATPTYSGGSSSVATVDSSGVVKAVGTGTTTIYVTVGDTKLECLVRVIKR